MIALVGGTVVDLEPPRVAREDVLVDGGKIVQIGGDFPPGTSRIDVHRCVVTPAFTVGHTHLYSSLACGMPPPAVPPTSFPEILARVWWKLDRALDIELVSISALVGAIEAVKRGVSCVIDHHSSPRAIDGSLDRIAEALKRVGLRGALCYETSDRDGKGARDAGLAENARFACGRSGDRASHFRAMTGAHAPFTLEDDTLDALADLSLRHSAPLHVHVAEDGTDPADAARRGTSLGARLARMGANRPLALIAHAVHLDPKDRERLAASGAWIATNARSNMTNAVGLAPAGRERIALGTDGIGADMLAEAHAHFLRHAEAKDGLAGEAVARLAGAQRYASLLFGGHDRAPRVAAGERADLVVLDYDPPTPMDAGNLASHVLFGWSSACVRDLIVSGKVVLRQREVLSVDSHAVADHAREAAARLWSRMNDVH